MRIVPLCGAGPRALLAAALLALPLAACDTADAPPADESTVEAVVDGEAFAGTADYLARRADGRVYVNAREGGGAAADAIGLTFPGAAGTYRRAADGTGTAGLFLVYEDGREGQAYVAALGGEIELTVEAITDRRARGTFRGVVYDERFLGPRTITGGAFDLTFETDGAD